MDGIRTSSSSQARVRGIAPTSASATSSSPAGTCVPVGSEVAVTVAPSGG